MRYPMTKEDWERFHQFLQYANGEGEHSLKHAAKAFIFEGEQSLEDRRKKTLMIASIMSNVVIHTFNALEEVGWSKGEGQADSMFDRERMKQLNQELNDLTSEGSYEYMTNQSAMRKLYSSLTDFLNDSMK